MKEKTQSNYEKDLFYLIDKVYKWGKCPAVDLILESFLEKWRVQDE